MPQAQIITKQSRRNSMLRRVVGDFKAKPTHPSENLVELVKTLQKIEITPEKLAINSKYMISPDGSKIEY